MLFRSPKGYLDPEDNETMAIEIVDIPNTGFKLLPGRVYLASTMERVGSNYYVPTIDGRSSWARLGNTVHLSAGFGDLGHRDDWTLEIVVQHITLVRPGMQIGQVAFETPEGEIEFLYNGRYKGQSGPTASRIAL